MATGSPPTTDIVTKLESEWKWLTTHLLLLALVAGLIFAGVYGIESLVARHDDANAKRLDAVAAQLAQSNQQTQAAQQQQIAILQKSIADVQAQAQKQVQVIVKQVAAVQTPEQAVPAIAQLATRPLEPQTITGSADRVSVLAVPLTQELGDFAIARTNLDAADKSLVAETAIAADSAKALDSEKTSHAADKTAAAADLTACKADAKKSKTKWFFVGVVIGLLTGRYL